MHSHAMTASHLKAIQSSFDNGICYHITVPEKVDELLKLVDKYAKPLDYGVPTCGTAFLRLNTTIKKDPNKDPWQMSGGALTQDSMTREVEDRIKTILDANPDYEVADRSLTAWVLNEWERYSVVFELMLTVKEKNGLQ